MRLNERAVARGRSSAQPCAANRRRRRLHRADGGSAAAARMRPAAGGRTQAALGVPLTLAYGYASVLGNEVYSVKTSDGTHYKFVLCGEGEWDGIERGWKNEKMFDVNDNSIVHFHPGTDGEVGDGSFGGDQKLDYWWNAGAGSIKRVTFSRIAHFVLKIDPDPGAPSATPTWLLHFRTMKIRDFDDTGTQTGYAFSTNPVRQYLDLLLRRQLFTDFTAGEEPRRPSRRASTGRASRTRATIATNCWRVE
jgi:hypothetical protein